MFDGTFFLGVKAAKEYVKLSTLTTRKSEIDVEKLPMITAVAEEGRGGAGGRTLNGGTVGTAPHYHRSG